MSKFRLPRKEKKSLKGKFLFYPKDKKGNSLMAQPRRLQEDYDAYKNGKLCDIFEDTESRKRRNLRNEKLDTEIFISDDKLKEYVYDIFREDLRATAYRTFLRAKTYPSAIEAYYNFVNAYHLYQKDEYSNGNICCLALERAEILVRKENRIGKSRK